MEFLSNIRRLIADGRFEEAWQAADGAQEQENRDGRIEILVARAEAARVCRRPQGEYHSAILSNLANQALPGDTDLLLAMGNALRQYRYYRPAIKVLSAALDSIKGKSERSEQLAEVMNAFGMLASDQGFLGEAEKFFRVSLSAIKKPDVHVNLAEILLRNGESAEGWLELSKRPWPTTENLDCDKWSPELPMREAPTQDLVIVDEGVAGDSIYFMNYVPVLRDRYRGKVYFAGSLDIFELGLALGYFDGVGHLDGAESEVGRPMGLRMMDLPSFLGLPEIPGDRISQTTRAPGPLRVGLCWRGNPLGSNDHSRSFGDIDAQALIAGLPNAEWYRLQLDGELDSLLAPEEPPPNWIETAKLILAMDVVVSVDTAVAHLAGTLGRKTIVLLPYVSDWRWGVQGEHCPRYPAAHLIRQKQSGNWEGPIKAAHEKLREMSAVIGGQTPMGNAG